MGPIGSGEPIDLGRCPAHHPALNALLNAFVDVALQHASADELEARLPWLSAEVAPSTRQARVEVAGDLPPERVAEMARSLVSAGVVDTVLAAPATPSEPPAASAFVPLLGDGTIEVLNAGGERLAVPHGAWTSATPENAQEVHRVLLEMIAARMQGSKNVVEVGCGVGTHTIALCRSAEHVIALDASRPAIAGGALNLAAPIASGRLELRLGRAQKALRRLLSRGDRADVVILHGMRKPFGAPVCEAVKALAARSVLVVSPSVMAAARDSAALHALGYTCERVVAIDTMPQTYHLMVVVELLLRP
jgi:tRNA/tmRNA/rRNA uracil-C5-methylase (TrmA/RlmC/RlmD family)